MRTVFSAGACNNPSAQAHSKGPPLSLPQVVTQTPTPSRTFEALFQELPAEIRFLVLQALPHQALSCLAEATPPAACAYQDDLTAACDRALRDDLQLFWPRPDMQPQDKFLYFAQASTKTWHQSPNEVACDRPPRPTPPSFARSAFLQMGRAPLVPPPLDRSAWHLDITNRSLQRTPSESKEYWETRLQQATMLCVQGRYTEAHTLINEIWSHLDVVPTAPTVLLRIAIQTTNELLFDQSLSRAQGSVLVAAPFYLTADIELCIKTLQFRSASKILSRLRSGEQCAILENYLRSASFNRFVDELAMLLIFRADDANLRIRAGDAEDLLAFLKNENLAPSAQQFLSEQI